LEIRSKSGRHAKTAWRDLCVIIGAYILKHCEITEEKIKINEASIKTHEIAKDEGIADLPAASTIRDRLSQIFLKAETLSMK
jgi:hypothetical protein